MPGFYQFLAINGSYTNTLDKICPPWRVASPLTFATMVATFSLTRMIIFMNLNQPLIKSTVAVLVLTPLLAFTTPTNPSSNLLENLSNAPGAPGFEGAVRGILSPIWKTQLSAFKVDGIGNISGVIPGGNASPKILLMAHMDEVGFMVRDITKDGFVQVEPLGGWRDQVAYAQRWKIMTSHGAIIGYSGEESGHIVPQVGQATKISANELHAAREVYIDVGARSREEAMTKYGLRPGLPVTPDTTFVALNQSGRYLGKGLDDRLGLALVTQVIQQMKHKAHPNEISVAATVQEEIGLRGAHVIANNIKPNVAINIEACIAGDHPFTATPSSNTYPSLGKGPCVYVYERSMLPSNELVEWIAALAMKNHIQIQYATAPNYGQDGSVMQQSGEGMPVINIGIPVRYAHQQAGVFEQADYDETFKLIMAMLENLDSAQVKTLMPA